MTTRVPTAVVLAILLAFVSPAFGNWLDAETGRWLRRDPAGYGAGMNLYPYVNDQPVTLTDPMGLAPSCEPIITLECWPIFPPALHCMIKVCDCHGNNCTWFSLNPEHGWPSTTEPNPVIRKERQDIETDREFTRYETWRGSALADCLKRVNDDNQASPWGYDPFNCNSNWYAAALLQCCLGIRVSMPFWAIGSNTCCSYDPYFRQHFNCQGQPGAGQRFYNRCDRREWGFSDLSCSCEF